MTFFNETPFSAELFEQFNMHGRMNGVVAVRGTFTARPDRRLILADMQAPFAWEDGYVSDPLSTPLVTVGDLIPFKPGTDITYLGATVAPDPTGQASWTCGIDVAGHISKTLRVTGPRWWAPASGRNRLVSRSSAPSQDSWRLTDPELARETPVCWSQAFGGSYAASDALDAERFSCPDNWIGLGWLDRPHDPAEGPWPAPRIEHPDRPITSWTLAKNEPHGLSPIPPFWNVRRRHAGTMDAAWLASRHPLAPVDFDFRFWQSAPADCVVEPWLQGHEIIGLRNLRAGHPLLRVALPGLALKATHIRPGQPDDVHRAVLDGVHFDFRDGADRVYLTWRCGFPWPDGSGDIILAGGPHGG